MKKLRSLILVLALMAMFTGVAQATPTVTMPIDLAPYITDAVAALIVIVGTCLGVKFGWILLRKAIRWARGAMG